MKTPKFIPANDQDLELESLIEDFDEITTENRVFMEVLKSKPYFSELNATWKTTIPLEEYNHFSGDEVQRQYLTMRSFIEWRLEQYEAKLLSEEEAFAVTSLEFKDQTKTGVPLELLRPEQETLN